MTPEFDAFISYSSADESWVQNLRNALTAKGIRVWLDKDQIRPGDLFIEALERGIASSKCVALVVSPESTRSGWVKEEYHRALGLQAQVRLIPLLLRNAEVPGFLSSRKWIDFRDPKRFADGIEELRWGITGDHSGQQPSLRPPAGRLTPGHPATRLRMVPVVIAGLLSIATGVVFRLWDVQAGFDLVEYLIVFAAWLLLALLVTWLWRATRKRKR